MESHLPFWEALLSLRRRQMEDYSGLFLGAKAALLDQRPTEDQRHRCQNVIEGVVEDIIRNLVEDRSPVLRIPKKTIGESSHQRREDFVSGLNPKNARRFALIVDVLSKSYVLLQRDTFATLRDVYYENVPLYEKQANLDRAVEDSARMLGVPRRALHLTATGKGLVAGNLTYVTYDGTRVRVSQANQGMMVPGCVSGLSGIESEANYILVIEKDASFQKLLEAQCLRALGPCILVTGKGYPDLCTRQFVHRLWVELQVPVLALVDADPYGLHIAAIYKFGALARDEPNLRVDGMALLGVLPTELRTLHLPTKALLPLMPRDYGKLASLEAHPALKSHEPWLHQIRALRSFEHKAEIQSLTHISRDYLTTVYLPTKLSSGNWIV